jgi:hypothetical protein
VQGSSLRIARQKHEAQLRFIKITEKRIARQGATNRFLDRRSSSAIGSRNSSALNSDLIYAGRAL